MKAIEPLLAKIAPYFDEIAVGLMALGGTIVLAGLAAVTAGMASLAAVMLMNPITWILAGITALAVYTYKNIDKMTFYWKRWVSNMGIFWGNISTGFKVMLHNFGVYTAIAIVKLLKGWVGFKLGVINVFNDLLSALNPSVNKLIEMYNAIPFLDDATPITLGLDTTKITSEIAMLDSSLKKLIATKQTFTEVMLDESLYTEPTGEGAGAGLDGATTDSGDGEGTGTDGKDDKTKGFLESIKMTANELESIFDKVETKAQSVFTSMLTGTQSLASGFKELGQTILTSVVGSFVQMALTYIKQKLLMFAMDKLGLGTTTALTVAAGTTMATALAPAATMMSLATAGGNAIPASAGIVSTYALSQGIALSGQLHDGIENVPNTGTYLLEQGERVVDKRLNKDMSSFLADQNQGGNTTTNNPTLNFNVTGGDADNVEQMLMNHRGKFEGMIRDIYAESAQNAPF